MVASMDHKRACDGDTGLNTGGTGAIAPNPFYTKEIAERCMNEIFLPTIQAMREEGCPFKGCLYFGLMITKDGPKVIEYNCRFGDPETQAVLPLLKSDLLTVMRAVENETLAETPVEFENKASCCVMLASGGYPEKYEKGKVIDFGASESMAQVFHSGTARGDCGNFVTSGGGSGWAFAVCATHSPKRSMRHMRRRTRFIRTKCISQRRIGERALKGTEV